MTTNKEIKCPSGICRILSHSRIPDSYSIGEKNPFSLLLNLFSASLPSFWSFVAFMLMVLTTIVTSVLPKINAPFIHDFFAWPAIPLNCAAQTCKHVSRRPLYPPRFNASPLSVLCVWATQSCFQGTRFPFSVFTSISCVLLPSFNRFYCLKNDLVVRVGRIRSWFCSFFHWLV